MQQSVRRVVAGVVLTALAALLPQLTGTAAGVGHATRVLYVVQGGVDRSNTCTAPSRPCATLGRAISESSGSSLIEVAAGTYFEHGLVITKTVQIVGSGSGSSFLDAGQQGQAILVQPGASLTLQGMTVRNGKSSAHAGAIENSGTLLLVGDNLVNNSAVDPGGAIVNYASIPELDNDRFVGNSDQGYGGAITNFGTIDSASGDVFNNNFAEDGAGAVNNEGEIGSLEGSSFSGNKAGYAGAIDNGGDIGTLNGDTFWNNNVSGYGGALNNVFGNIAAVSNDTFIGNSVNDSLGQGGAIEQDEGIISILADDTITGNSAVIGGGIDNEEGSTIGAVSGVIVALNTGTQGPNCFNFGGQLVDAGYNLTSDSGADCGFSSEHHDLVGVDPDLRGLGAYGGKTLTDPPLPASPAVDAGPNITCPTSTDQRGVPRPQVPGGACDIGAVELAPPDPASLTPSSGPESGGISVRITGSGFTLATGVTFGRTPVRFRVVNDGSITLITPPGQGSEPVRISTPDGHSGRDLSFNYFG